MQSELKPILCKAAVAYAPNQPMTIQEIWVAPPKAGEVRVRVISNALCHTDVYRLDGHDSEGEFPAILGHEATAVVESVGKGVTRVKVGDIVVPCYTPECMEKDCIYCNHEKSNLCPKIRTTQGKGVMPDGTSRFTNKKGQTIYHFMGCSTFSQYTVLAQISAAKINEHADLNKVCMLGCGVSTGWGAVMNNTNMQAGKTVAVWGLGAVGLSVIQAARIRGAKKIYAIDTNSKKFDIAKKFGATHFYEPTKEKDGKTWILEQEKWGVHYTYDCTGNTGIMREALQASHRGFGQSCVIGVAESGKQISTKSFQLVTGRKWLGTAFGGWKSLQDVPKLVNRVALGEWPIDQYVTHQFQGIDKVNQSVDALHGGECLRAVVKISPPPQIAERLQIKVINSVPHFGGVLKTVSHWSKCCNCFMNFNIFLPDQEISQQRGKPYSSIYFLSGLSSTHTNAPQKSGFGRYAAKHRLAMVFPDTSPRNTNIPNISDDWQMGESASYYVNATSDQCKKYFQMWTYITEELPDIVSSYFPVRKDNMSVTGFSMGGHGALIAGLKTDKYRSASAFSPMANPTHSENWGKKAFKLFFDDPEKQGKAYDATQILKSGKYNKVPLLMQIGTSDQFAEKVKFENLEEELRKHEDLSYQIHHRPYYNHSFHYVSSFLEEHIDFHAKYLKWHE